MVSFPFIPEGDGLAAGVSLEVVDDLGGLPDNDVGPEGTYNSRPSENKRKISSIEPCSKDEIVSNSFEVDGFITDSSSF